MSGLILLAARLPGETERVTTFESDQPVVRDDLDYWRALARYWGERTIVNVEHDIEYSGDLAQALLDCPEPACTYAYLLHHIAPEPFYAQRTGPLPPAGGEWISKGDEWADYSGIGFCKLAPTVRTVPLAESDWRYLDIAVTRAIQPARWHVHWPAVAHHHH